MLAWIIYFREAARYNKQYIQFYMEEGAKLGVEVKLILVEDLEFGVRDNTWFIKYRNKTVPSPDFVIFRAIYPLLSKHLEYMGMRVFNNSFISELCNDKARTYQYLAKTGIIMIDSSFYRNDQVTEVLSRVNSSTVIKAVAGHGGSQVYLVEPEDVLVYEGDSEADEDTMNFDSRKYRNDIIIGLKNSDVVIQPLTGNKHQDLRVYVIGNEIIAAVLRTAKNGFKSNFSLGGEVRLYQLSGEEITLVNKIIKEFEFGLVGIDFIVGDNGELIFNEIEDVVGARMLYHCSDINLAELYLNYILKKLKAEK